MHEFPTIVFDETPRPPDCSYVVSYRGYTVWLKVERTVPHRIAAAHISFTDPDGNLLGGGYFECEDDEMWWWSSDLEHTSDDFRWAFQRMCDKRIDELTA